ncbi:MAG: hypothetical protein M0Z58_02325 [Nitrospiraceae bacterium]|nr:hypothetical protein [Nitrospiraceae bacterium]
MVPVARITHRTKGRLRIKVPPRKGDGEYFASLAAGLLKVPGITDAETNPITGSVLILHATEPEKIIAYANENGLFRILLDKMNKGDNNGGGAAGKPPGRPASKRLTSRIADVFKQTDSMMLEMSGGQLDIGGTAFFALLGVGIYQIASGNFMAPAWYAAFWYALNIFLKALPEAEPAPGLA